MKTLEEFLTERADIQRGRAHDTMAVQKEWVGAVRRLIDQVSEWLQAADKEHLLEIEESSHRLREIDVGVYTAPGLVIRLEAQEARVIPIARMVVGPDLSNGIMHIVRAFGRVDMTDGEKKFLLFRTAMEPSDAWVILEDEGFTFKNFTRESFEEATQSLLQ